MLLFLVDVLVNLVVTAATADDDADNICEMSNIHVLLFHDFIIGDAGDGVYHAGIGSLMDQGIMPGSAGE